MISFATALGASLWTFPFLGVYLILKRMIPDPYLLILMRQGVTIGTPCLSGYFGYLASNSIQASCSVAFIWLAVLILVRKLKHNG